MVRLGGGTSTTLYKAKALDPITSAFILPKSKMNRRAEGSPVQ
jgi:hypothetical protein